MIARYTEKSLQKKRNFELYEDKIVISGKSGIGSEYELPVPLEDLRKEKAVVNAKSDGRMILWAIPGVIAFAIVMLYSEDLIRTSLNLYYALLAFSVVLAGIGIVFSKKFKGCIYHYKSGEIAFDISELGNSSNEFDSFCDEIDKRILS